LLCERHTQFHAPIAGTVLLIHTHTMLPIPGDNNVISHNLSVSSTFTSPDIPKSSLSLAITTHDHAVDSSTETMFEILGIIPNSSTLSTITTGTFDSITNTSPVGVHTPHHMLSLPPPTPSASISKFPPELIQEILNWYQSLDTPVELPPCEGPLLHSPFA
jgi:hypothetical protein